MPSAFENLAVRVMRDLIRDLNVTPEQAAGIVGNIAGESGFLAIQERNPWSGRGGFGWQQWTGSRRVAFEQYCRDRALDPTSYAANYGFMIYELRGSEAKSLQMLRLTTTPKAAAETFEAHNERAGVKNWAGRVRFAERAMALWQRASPPAPQPVPTSTPQPVPSPPMPPVVAPDPVLPPKPWYQSRVLVGALVGIVLPLIARVIPAVGLISVDTATDTALKAIDFIGPIIGGWLVVQGRLTSIRPIAGTQAAEDVQRAHAAQEAYHTRADQAASDLATQPVQEAWVPAPSRGFVPGVSMDNLDDLVTGAQRVVATAQAIAPIIGPVLSALVAASKALEQRQPRERPEPDPQM
jgi:hypothetical protein